MHAKTGLRHLGCHARLGTLTETVRGVLFFLRVKT